MSGTLISPANLTVDADGLLNEMFKKQHLTLSNFRIHNQSSVDGETWYTVSSTRAVAKWIRSQDRAIWHEHMDSSLAAIHNTFDIHEKLYTLLALKWS